MNRNFHSIMSNIENDMNTALIISELQQWKIRAEKAEAAAKKTEAELNKQAFHMVIDNKLVQTRKQLMEYITMADFIQDEDIETRVESGTVEFLRTNGSSTSQTTIVASNSSGQFDMSRFKISQLSKNDRMNLVLLTSSTDEISKITKNKLSKIYPAVDLEFLIQEEVQILKKIQTAVRYAVLKSSLSEVKMQAFFQLYVDGLYESFNIKYNSISANGIKLEVPVNIVQDNIETEVIVSGFADLIIERSDEHYSLNAEDKRNTILHRASVLGELKRLSKNLNGSSKKVDACTSQHLIQLKALVAMRQNNVDNNDMHITILARSFISDFKNFRFTLAIKINDEIKYYTTSLFRNPDQLIISLLFLIIDDISLDDIKQICPNEKTFDALQVDAGDKSQFDNQKGCDNDENRKDTSKSGSQFDKLNNSKNRCARSTVLTSKDLNIKCYDDSEIEENRLEDVRYMEEFDYRRFGIPRLTYENLRKFTM